jgi:hypothetical protein
VSPLVFVTLYLWMSEPGFDERVTLIWRLEETRKRKKNQGNMATELGKELQDYGDDQ